MQYTFLSIFFCAMLFFNISCRKISEAHDEQRTLHNLTANEEMAEKIALISETESLLQKVYVFSEVVNEVNAAIFSEYERDESISLLNLLDTMSGLYRHEPFRRRPVSFGAFAREFRKAFKQGEYPHVSKVYGSILNGIIQRSSNLMANNVGVVDTVMESWILNNVKIYFPYSENYSSSYDPGSPFINDPNGLVLVTTVAADREADSGPGSEPYVYWPDRSSPKEIRYRSVTVNDAYAENTRATHIINVADNVLDPPPPTTPPVSGVPVYKVFIGWVRCTRQLDKLISIENGGGPELRFSRGFAVMDANGQVTTGFPFIAYDGLKRKDVRRSRWKQILLLWDSNWKPEKVEQALGIWERDTRGTVTLNSIVSYSSNGQTITTNVASTGQSQDAIIRNFGIDRNFFFSNGFVNQGWGFMQGWPIFDGSADVSYTMPFEILN